MNKIILTVCVVVIIFVVYIFIGIDRGNILITRYIEKNKKIPLSFDGFKIVQVSDLHSQIFGNEQSTLLAKVQAENPDIIVLTGDIVDDILPIDGAMKFLDKVSEIAPTYYVTGNHELKIKNLDSIIHKIKKKGISVIDNENSIIERNGEFIGISGIRIQAESTLTEKTETTKKYINSVKGKCEYNILLSHQPEFIDIYSQSIFDLVLSGHTHGGQMKIFGKALLCPDQGIFPKYSRGEYLVKNTKLIISSGLGNKTSIPRVYNGREIVSITLKAVSPIVKNKL